MATDSKLTGSSANDYSTSQDVKTDPYLTSESAPPAYSTLSGAVAADMASLSVGDPKEMISVPMIHSHENTRLRDVLIPFSSKKGKIKQTVIVRKMTREYDAPSSSIDSVSKMCD